MNLSNDTSLNVTLGLAIVAIGFLVRVIWRVANLLRDIRDEMKAMNGKIDDVASDSFKASAMERWAADLRWRNRDKNLDVPDPRRAMTSDPFPLRPENAE